MESRFRVHDQGTTEDLDGASQRQGDVQGECAIAGFLKLTRTADVAELESQRAVQGGGGRGTQSHRRSDVVDGDDRAKEAGVTSHVIVEGMHTDLEAGSRSNAKGSASGGLRPSLEEPTTKGLFDLNRARGERRRYGIEGDGVFRQGGDF